MYTKMYTEKVLKHFRNPKNLGTIKNPDGYARVGNVVCGDVMELFLKIGSRKAQRKTEDTEKFIKDIKFQTLGCAAAIATSSVLTEMVKGKSLKEAKKITGEHVVRALGGLPNFKIHCSLLIVQALKKAIKDSENHQKN